MTIAPQLADLGAVVLVGELAGAMVELQLLQCRERAVALLREREAPLGGRVGRMQTIVRRSRLAEKRQCDRDHHGDGDHRREHERNRHGTAGESASS